MKYYKIGYDRPIWSKYITGYRLGYVKNVDYNM